MLLVLLCACFLSLTNGQMAVGGWSSTDVSLSDPNVQTALNFIKASQYGLGATDLGVSKVLSAQTQVVAGQNLKLKLQMTNGLICKLTIWSRPWLTGAESAQITHGPECSTPRQARMSVGGVSQAKSLDANDAQTMNALQFATCAYNDRSNSMYASILGDLSGVTYTEQLTAGITYEFKGVPLQFSTCSNKGCAALTSSSCQAQQSSSQAQTCNFSIQYQAWMTPQYTMNSFQCQS